jgi:beta-mannosidase
LLIFKNYLVIFLIISSAAFSQNIKKIILSDNWQFGTPGKENKLPAVVPGTVHTDLLNNKIIDDPYTGNNEENLQWIGWEDWEYVNTFDAASIYSFNNIEIVFEGLDTYAKVYLNDSLIIDANNMFRTWQKDCKNLLKKDKNMLRIVFRSAEKITDSISSSSLIKLPGGKYNTIRKAAYHFGWDWGPKFVTAGIWRPVYIRAWNDVKIEDVSFQQKSISKEEAELHVPFFLNCFTRDLYKISVKDISGTITYAEKTDSLFEGFNLDAFDFSLYNPRLWWTRELGSPEMYTFRFEVRKNNIVVDEKVYYTGIRKLELVRDKDSIGESFYFKLNNVPLFIKGANYIPQDNFLSGVTKEKYKSIIENCTKSNINMLRVWGGGVYEDDEFYKQCDFSGILVWQDFMFACAMYPGDSAFMQNVKIEASQNVSRLKNHPCIALWCGNNEIEEGWNNWGWQKQFGYSKKDSAKIWNDYEMIFNKAIPNSLKNIIPSANYISTSPQFGWGHPESMKQGDSHYWGVWWGMEPFETYKKKVPRFMSEYGFQGFPDIKTIDSVISPAKRYLYSDEMKNHQKHPVGFETIRKYMNEEYNEPKSFEDYIYVSQLLQAYGIKTAVEAQRRAKPYCMGTMYWQLNDCWPVVSWSGIDYYGRWKAMQYFVKDAYRDILVSPYEENNLIKVNVISEKQYDFDAILHIQLKDFSGNVLRRIDTSVIIPKNSSGVFYNAGEDELLKGYNKNEIVLSASLIMYDVEIYNNLLYFVKTKELNLAPANISFDIDEELLSPEYNILGLYIKSDKFVKNLYLYTEGSDSFFEENYFDLFPGETVAVYCKTKLNKEDLSSKLKYYYLNK